MGTTLSLPPTLPQHAQASGLTPSVLLADPSMTQLPGSELLKGPVRKESESYKQGLPEASAPHSTAPLDSGWGCGQSALLELPE